MTCKRRKRAYGCKGASAVHRQCPGIVRTGGKFLHVIARSEATWQSASPAAAHSGELRLRRIRKASRIRPNCCHLARFLCGENGLPRQCAHWLAMTCRRQRRVSGCKDVPTVIARREATWQSALLAVRHDGKQYFGQMRRNCEFALGTAGFFCKMFGSKFFHFGTRREGNRTEEEKKRTERKVEEAEEGGLGG